MITSLSPQLKQHIEQYIEDIDHNSVSESIIKCPLDSVDDYIHILRYIDIEPPTELKSYIDIASHIAAKVDGNSYCTNVVSYDDNSTEYVFDIDPKPFISWENLQHDLQSLCPYHFVQTKISHVFYGTPKRYIEVKLFPVSQFKL